MILIGVMMMMLVVMMFLLHVVRIMIIVAGIAFGAIASASNLEKLLF